MPTDRFRTIRPDLPDMSADLVAGRRFGQTWRGYDPEEVRQFLAEVAAQLRALRERWESAESARRDAERRALHPEMDEATLMSAVGEETAGILRSARSAATEITMKAETAASAIVKAAESDAASMVSAAEAKAAETLVQAESLLASYTAEAEAAAAEIREGAQVEADHLREVAQQQANALAEESAREHAEMIATAQSLREKILSDLARRRKLASVQIEQLRAGRERLLDAYMVVRRTLEEVTDELQRVDAEARAAAGAVGRQHANETAEPLDLRSDEFWESLETIGEQKAGMPAPPQPEMTAEPAPRGQEAAPPVVRTPKVGRAAAGEADPQGDKSAMTAKAERQTGKPAAARQSVPGPKAMTTSVSNVRVLGTPDLVPAPHAGRPSDKAGSNKRGSEDPAHGHNDGGAVVPETDAIESVRVLRQGHPEAVTGVPAMPTAEEVGPAVAAGPGGPESIVHTLQRRRREDGVGPNGHGEVSHGEVSHGEGGNQRDAQDLFARIRASRAEARTLARKALSEGREPQGTGPLREGGAESHALPPSPETSPPSPEGVGPAEVGTAQTATADEREFFKRRDQVTGHLESSLARKLKRVLQDEQNSLLDRLRSLKGVATPANILPNAEEHPDRFMDAGRSLLEEAATAGSQSLAAFYPDAVTPAPPGHEAVDDLVEELGKGIAEPLRQRLEVAFRSADEDHAELADVLGSAYREWKTQRIEEAAHDQVAAAFARGAYLALPEGAALRWVVDESEGPCPDCEDNALAGEQPRGQAWPTGQLHPPAHPGCRCALAPVHQAVSLAVGTTGKSPAE